LCGKSGKSGTGNGGTPAAPLGLCSLRHDKRMNDTICNNCMILLYAERLIALFSILNEKHKKRKICIKQAVM
jgi:hypothetical protein